MNKEKDSKYYVRIFVISAIGVIAYLIYLSLNEDDFDIYNYGVLFIVPLFFTFITYMIDQISNLTFGLKRRKRGKYDEFIYVTSTALKNRDLFAIEDFRKMRESVRFQKALNHVFQIISEGESEGVTYELLEKKFKKDTLEYKALQIVIEESKKMNDLS